MDHATKTIQNNALASLTASAPGGVVGAIRKASAKTGVDFAYLMQQACAESSFDAKAKAKSSSACGLFQFIDSTWMSMVEKYGARHGIDTAGLSKSQILAMRNDPEKASAMAAEFARENENTLKRRWGGDIGSTELYFAHFLGAGQASAFLKARDESPSQAAALLFPKAAQANRNVFYDTKTGRAKSLDEVYAFFDRKFRIESGSPGGPDTSSGKMIADSRAAKPGSDVSTLAFMTKERPPSMLFQPADTRTHGKDQDFAFAKSRAFRPSYNASLAYSALAQQQSLLTNPVEVILLSRLEMPDRDKKDNF